VEQQEALSRKHPHRDEHNTEPESFQLHVVSGQIRNVFC